MQDSEIINLYFARDERAIKETAARYENFCRSIAMRILSSEQDAEECVNDTWLRAWNSIPPERPPRLRMWLGKVIRNIALDRYRYDHAAKRDRSLDVSLDELEECVPLPDSDSDRLPALFNRFLGGLDEKDRNLFVGRYWLHYTLEQLSAGHGLTVGAVRYSLDRTRRSLKEFLQKEDYTV